MDGLEFTCSDSEKILSADGQAVCRTSSGQQVIDDLKFGNLTIGEDFLILLGLWVGYRLLCFFILWKKMRNVNVNA